jgi:predicted GIY-YIG superfamily endonuclease
MVYLIHFHSKLSHAQHYLGSCANDGLDERLARHKAGNGSALMRAVEEAEITWSVVRTWKQQGRVFERHLKNQKNAPRFCPLCNPKGFWKHGNQ